MIKQIKNMLGMGDVGQSANVQEESDADNGQGSDLSGLKARKLSYKAKTPDQVSETPLVDNPALYTRVVTPEDVQVSRVVVQLTQSEGQAPISSQLNSNIKMNMNHTLVQGGDRTKL